MSRPMQPAAISEGFFYLHMRYNIPAKPTLYNGIKFRSKLEAQWAAFFDIIEWDYLYEPYEINGQLPDFIIKCNSTHYPTKTLIVEIKPFVFADEGYKIKILESYKEIKAHILILCDSPFLQKNRIASIGYGSQFVGDSHENLYEIDWKCIDDIGSEYMYYDSMIKDEIDRKSFIEVNYVGDAESYHGILKNWRTAGNTVQFKSY